MARDTKARIQAAALDLIARQGLQRTSLRQIAEQLGITKPALYYHFASRDELVHSLLQPLLDESDALLADLESATDPSPEVVLAATFDLLYRHRHLTNALVRDLTMLPELDIGTQIVAWRQRIIDLVAGPDPTLEARVRAVVAVGGLADSTVLFAELPAEKFRSAALRSALEALGG